MEEKHKNVVSVVAGAQVVVPCSGAQAFTDSLAFFTSKLGLRVELISPADDPSIAVIVGLGVRLRLERRDPSTSHNVVPPALVLTCNDLPAVKELLGNDKDVVAPNGSVITLLSSDPPLVIPPMQQQLIVNKIGSAKDAFKMGRAGMEYRDLIPGRLDGRFIASHIRILDGGAVPDYCHFHKVRFQMIFCAKGWVRVVYEDQGDSFIMNAGDCVLQPPRIRHRVLECSAGLEVVEIGCPAVHDTCGDLEMTLPNGVMNPQRSFDDQRFNRHVAAEAKWAPSTQFAGFLERDTGIGRATDGLGGVRVLKVDSSASSPTPVWHHEGEFAFFFILAGSVSLIPQTLEDSELERDGKPKPRIEGLATGDTVVIPAKAKARWMNPSESLEILFISLPDPLSVSQF